MVERSSAVPKLAGDTFRAWIALIPAAVAGVAVSFLWRYSIEKVTLAEVVKSAVAGYLWTIAVYFGVYSLLTIRVFGGRTARQLVAYVSATTPHRRGEKVSRILSGGGAISWSVSIAVTALLSVVVVAFNPSLRSAPLILAAGGLLVVTGWVTVPVAFAVHYLRQHSKRPGFRFPGDDEPVFADFLYLAIQVSTTFSASDVDVLTRVMRRRITAQALVAFVFNSVIVALLVSALLVVAPS